MEKISIVVLLLVACFSSLAIAQTIPGTAEAGFFLGDASASATEDVDGFWYIGEILTEPVGAMVDLNAFSGVTFEGNRMDFLGSYVVPNLDMPVSVRALAGYSITNLYYSYDSYKYKGFVVGAMGEFSPMDKLTLTGSLLFGLGMDCVVDRYGYAPGTIDSKRLSYTLGASYEITDKMLAVCGLRGDKYTISDADLTAKVDGFYVGVEMPF